MNAAGYRPVRPLKDLRIDSRRKSEREARKPSLISMKDVLWFLYLYPLRLLVSRLPASSLYRIGRALDAIFQFIARRKRVEASQVMALALGATSSAERISSISRRYISNAVYRALDDLTMMHPAACARLEPPEFYGLENLKNALTAGRGVILTSGHFYANRLAKHQLRNMGYPVVSVRNGRPNDRWMGRVGARFLQRRYIEFLHGIIGDEVFIQDPECSLKIFRCLRAGGIVNVHIDANFSEQCLRIPFLGQSRTFSKGMLEIARLSGCAVIPLLCLGNQMSSSVTFGERVVLKPSRSREEFVDMNLPGLARILEDQILQHPDQWEGWVRL